MSALPFACNKTVAQAAADVGVHYADLTEDVDTSHFIASLATKSSVCFIPQCGIAPGFVSIAAAHLVKLFDKVDSVKMRVGALPIYPTNRLKYNLTWSTDGLINEYCNPCEVILDGRLIKVPPLEGYERFSLDGDEYETFHTSGGLGTLCHTLHGKVRELNYKTIRYPGHRDLMKFLLQDLRLGVEHAPAGKSGVAFNRRLAMDLLDHAVARTLQDVVVVFINGIGIDKSGMRRQINFKRSIPATQMFGRLWPAIELTTAAGVCAMVDLHRLGKLPATGFIKQEAVSLAEFNATVFGLAYENPGAIERAVLGG
jgi:saccharopine dehydrogenase-like NADP-dependent oxidoreductase